MEFWRKTRGRVLLLAAFGLALVALTHAGPARSKDGTPVVAPVKFATLHIPRLEVRPTIADFLNMEPSPAIAGKMLKVDGFQQRDPKDGAPVSQKTEVYLGYTDKNLYVVCICFDSEPSAIRARLVRRELINDDDQFGFVLDTFHDRQHGLFLRHGVEFRGQTHAARLRSVVRDSLQVATLSGGRHSEMGSIFRARHQAQQRGLVLPAYHQQCDRIPRPGHADGGDGKCGSQPQHAVYSVRGGARF